MDTVTILEKPETLNWDYDEDADVLYLSIGEPQPAIGIDIGEGVVLRYTEDNMAYDEGLAQRVRAVMVERTGVAEKKMFGGVSFMLDGNMACGVIGDELIVRVGPQQYGTAVMSPHARPFDFTGKPMKGWIVVVAEGVTSDADLAQWVQRGVAFARSLPPK
jgi:hypothetical protein